MLLARLGLWLERRPLLRFVLSVAALLPAMFGIWYAAGAALSAPAALLAESVLQLWIPEFVAQFQRNGAVLTVVSSYGEAAGAFFPAEEVGNRIGFSVNTRILSYSMPFFAALYFSTPLRGGLDRFAWGFITLWLLLAVGIVATVLKDFMLTMGAAFLDNASVPTADIIALAYQFSTLMVPPLAPVLLWAYAASDSPAFSALLSSAPRPAHSSD
ncbi:MAG: exosortase H-associated membrane protein [Halieaceae bacterium]|jgi:hypothetical protein|nr:exosortase H-associated membrane protein [Halieaceae bacterium]